MLFKRTALFFLTLASVILLVHNMVPHVHEHHDDVFSETHGHSHHHHHDAATPVEDPNADNADLTDIFSFINHHAEGITFLSGYKIYKSLSQQVFSQAFLLPQNICFDDFILPPLLCHSPAEFFEYSFFVPCTNALRGPPAIAV